MELKCQYFSKSDFTAQTEVGQRTASPEEKRLLHNRRNGGNGGNR